MPEQHHCLELDVLAGKNTFKTAEDRRLQSWRFFMSGVQVVIKIAERARALKGGFESLPLGYAGAVPPPGGLVGMRFGDK